MRLRLAALLALLAPLTTAACRPRETPAPRMGTPVKVNDLDGGAGQSEPSIAVAEDGRTLLAGWIDWSESVPHVRLARSTNGGASFAASRRVDADPRHSHGQAEATLAQTAGRFAFGWIGCRPDADSLENHACDVFAMTSSNGGVSWSSTHTVAEGGHARRDRPWLVADGVRFGIAWSEVSAEGSSWKYAREGAGGAFETVWTLPHRSAKQPPVTTSAGLEALLVDHEPHEPRVVTLEHRLVSAPAPFGSQNWRFPPEASLLPYSLGAFAAQADREAWVAIPDGNGENADLRLEHRAPASTFENVRTLRTAAATRVGLPWILSLRGPGRFLATWIEEEPDGWRVRTRLLGPGTAVSRAADVSPGAFTFAEASRTRNVGDFLGAATAGDAFWVTWSDTGDGDADIWLVRGEIR